VRVCGGTVRDSHAADPYNRAVNVNPVARHVVSVVVAVYLCAAGWFFVLAPWSGFWRSRVVAAGPPWLIALLDHPALRGALTGFGVVHFWVSFSWLALIAARHE